MKGEKRGGYTFIFKHQFFIFGTMARQIHLVNSKHELHSTSGQLGFFNFNAKKGLSENL
jgi:hypothetical protein